MLCVFQVAPPSVVARMLPLPSSWYPTAQTCVASVQATERRKPVVEVCVVQDPPPSVVAMMTLVSLGLKPTAQPSVALAKAMEVRNAVVPEACWFQVVPPSVVASMVPSQPTAQP